MVELLLFLNPQVGFGAAHPENVALKKDFPVTQRAPVVIDQALERERKKAIHAAVDEFVGLASFLTKKVRECAVWQNVFAPDYRIAQENDARGIGDVTQTSLIEPI